MCRPAEPAQQCGGKPHSWVKMALLCGLPSGLLEPQKSGKASGRRPEPRHVPTCHMLRAPDKPCRESSFTLEPAGGGQCWGRVQLQLRMKARSSSLSPPPDRPGAQQKHSQATRDARIHAEQSGELRRRAGRAAAVCNNHYATPSLNRMRAYNTYRLYAIIIMQRRD